ncbi:polysaccharide biosynthesis C-terminal domain-containing protein [Compostibacter hankyongensis]|uniref:O13/O129/O135 family O-antigen flippase n=1 Tax=Compostibacter hankyongensis TaxID=1007089 RepID=A0ABP8G8Z4_9BACT
MKRFIQDFIKVMFSKAGVILFNLGNAVVVARGLGPDANGLIAVLVVYPTLFMTVGSLGISQATTYYVGKDMYGLGDVKRAIVQLWILSTVFCLAACFILVRYFSDGGENLVQVMLAIAPVPFCLFNTYSSGIFLGKKQIGLFNRIEWLPPLFVFLLNILFVYGLKLGITGALTGLAAGPFIMTLVLLLKNDFIRFFSWKVNYVIARSILSLGIVYAVALLIVNLNYRVDVVIMDKLSTKYQLGIYSKGAALTEYLWQIPMLFSALIFSRSAGSKDPMQFSRQIARLLRMAIIAIGAASVVLMVFSAKIIVLLFGDAYAESSSVLRVLAPGVLLLTVFKILNMDLAGRGKPWISVKAMLPALVVNVILNLMLVPGYGAYGAALASTVSYGLAAVLFIGLYAREVQLPVRKILEFSLADFHFMFNLTRGSKLLKNAGFRQT